MTEGFKHSCAKAVGTLLIVSGLTFGGAAVAGAQGCSNNGGDDTAENSGELGIVSPIQTETGFTNCELNQEQNQVNVQAQEQTVTSESTQSQDGDNRGANVAVPINNVTDNTTTNTTNNTQTSTTSFTATSSAAGATNNDADGDDKYKSGDTSNSGSVDAQLGTAQNNESAAVSEQNNTNGSIDQSFDQSRDQDAEVVAVGEQSQEQNPVAEQAGSNGGDASTGGAGAGEEGEGEEGEGEGEEGEGETPAPESPEETDAVGAALAVVLLILSQIFG